MPFGSATETGSGTLMGGSAANFRSLYDGTVTGGRTWVGEVCALTQAPDIGTKSRSANHLGVLISHLPSPPADRRPASPNPPPAPPYKTRSASPEPGTA